MRKAGRAKGEGDARPGSEREGERKKGEGEFRGREEESM